MLHQIDQETGLELEESEGWCRQARVRQNGGENVVNGELNR